MRPAFPITLVLAAVLLLTADGRAMLTPPARLLISDSSSLRLDKGVEFTRATEYFGTTLRPAPALRVITHGRWKTDWQTPTGAADRIRQDGRWYVGADRTLRKPVALWLAASGEHFDDRPFNRPPPPVPMLENPARSPQLAANPGFHSAFSVNAVRLLRAGVGASVRPWTPLGVDLGAGPVQDRRIGRLRNGMGVWSRATVDDWSPGGFDQSLDFGYNRESPKESDNEDLTARYTVFRQFFEGNSNRTEIAASLVSRDIFIASTGDVARRTERNYVVRDVLTYGIMEGVRAEMSGDVLRSKTEQSQPRTPVSSLEENQAGFSTALEVQRGRTAGRLHMGVKTVTQTIRGDILQGRKADLTLRARTMLPDRSHAAIRLGVAKYVLDTRSESNHDDRDELRYSMEGSWSKPVFPGMVYELHGIARLDHLVYIYRQSSANNRWSRFFLAGSSIQHRPSAVFGHALRVNVSANYQAYDFDTDPQTARSTIHRRFIIGDSLAWTAAPRLLLSGRIDWQREEFGRLFWESFEAERSDETRSLTVAAQFRYRIAQTVHAGAGALWDTRIGERFPAVEGQPRIVFQDLESYGPLFMLERTAVRGVFINLHGRALRQFQLARDPRWIVTGEMTGGLRW